MRARTKAAIAIFILIAVTTAAMVGVYVILDIGDGTCSGMPRKHTYFLVSVTLAIT